MIIVAPVLLLVLVSLFATGLLAGWLSEDPGYAVAFVVMVFLSLGFGTGWLWAAAFLGWLVASFALWFLLYEVMQLCHRLGGRSS
jgi:hypothetical protein